MDRRVRVVVAAASVPILLLLVAACSTDVKPLEDRVGAVEQNATSAQAKLVSLEGKAGKIAAPPSKVWFAVTGVELKGSTVTKDLAVPPVNPKTLSDGYRYKAPGEADKADATKWEVSTYVWNPGAITVLQGDEVTLRIFIVNGDKHTTWIEGPDGQEVVKEQEQNRGREYLLTFTAAQVGHYMLHCNEHDPTMHAVISVLPRS